MSTWMAPARALIDHLPPTLPGLVLALRTADEACLLLARSIGSRSLTTGPSAAALTCATALACLDADDRSDPSAPGVTGGPAPERGSLSAPVDPGDPRHARELDGLLRDCITLALAVLDNDEIDLDPVQVIGIGRAMALLERARAQVLGLRP